MKSYTDELNEGLLTTVMSWMKAYSLHWWADCWFSHHIVELMKTYSPYWWADEVLHWWVEWRLTNYSDELNEGLFTTLMSWTRLTHPVDELNNGLLTTLMSWIKASPKATSTLWVMFSTGRMSLLYPRNRSLTSRSSSSLPLTAVRREAIKRRLQYFKKE